MLSIALNETVALPCHSVFCIVEVHD